MHRTASRRRVDRTIVAVFLTIAAARHALAQTEQPAANQPDWAKLIRRSVAEYQIFRDTPEKTPLSLQEQAILRWANPTRITQDGFTYLWTAKGRPEAVACIYAWGPDAIRHNFQSLAKGPLVAQRSGRRVWNPAQPGVNFAPVPGSPEPAASAAERLRQMKALAGRYRCVLLPGYWNPTEEQLRLLPRELYRYQSEAPELLDGALFAFVQGTDPEALLLFEAVRSGQRSQWQYALARRTQGGLEVRDRERVVWRIPAAPPGGNPRDPYIEFEYPIPGEAKGNRDAPRSKPQ